MSNETFLEPKNIKDLTHRCAPDTFFMRLGASETAQKCERFPPTQSAAQRKYLKNKSKVRVWQQNNLCRCGE
jgi:hypothetical protein